MQEDDIYAQLYSFDNLLLAWQKAARGKRGTPAVAAFAVERAHTEPTR